MVTFHFVDCKDTVLLRVLLQYSRGTLDSAHLLRPTHRPLWHRRMHTQAVDVEWKWRITDGIAE